MLVCFEEFRRDELSDLHKRSSIRTNEEAAHILRVNGLDSWGAFVVGLRWERRDFDGLAEYVRRLKTSFLQFTVLTPLPGTQFFRQKIGELTALSYGLFGLLHSVLPSNLLAAHLYAEMAGLYCSTTMGPWELKERIRTGRTQISGLRRVNNLPSEVTNAHAYLRGGERPVGEL